MQILFGIILPLRIYKRKLGNVLASKEYSPSSWPQRVLVAVLAGVATALAIYMGLYQWKLIPNAWDPVFGDGTEKVLVSDISHEITRWVRLPDAVFGALAFLSDIVFAIAGCRERWIYRPWLVILFGLDVIPIGCVSLILVALQGMAVGHWCFFCIITATISTVLVFLAYSEVYCTFVYLHEIWKRTKNFSTVWNAFWGVPCEVSLEAKEAVLQRQRKSYVGKN